jgi:hypothetical protein
LISFAVECGKAEKRFAEEEAWSGDHVVSGRFRVENLCSSLNHVESFFPFIFFSSIFILNSYCWCVILFSEVLHSTDPAVNQLFTMAGEKSLVLVRNFGKGQGC